MRRYSNYNRPSSYTPRSMRRLERNAKKHIIWIIILCLVLGYAMVFWIIPFMVGGLTYFNKYKQVEKGASIVEDTAVAPPVLNIPYEATNTATIKIKGYATSDARVELYVGNDLKDTVSVGPDGAFEAPSIALTEGTNAIYGKTVLGNKTSLPSKAIRVGFSSEKPKLEISEPADNHEVKGGDKKIKVSGITDPENNVLINGAYVIVNNEGKFSTEISLNDGDNTISIQAVNEFGTTENTQRIVKYVP
jgi:hypothetical protein